MEDEGKQKEQEYVREKHYGLGHSACNQHYRIPERQCIVVVKATKLNNSKNVWQSPFGKGKVGD